jgi:hypothetical protein
MNGDVINVQGFKNYNANKVTRRIKALAENQAIQLEDMFNKNIATGQARSFDNLENRIRINKEKGIGLVINTVKLKPRKLLPSDLTFDKFMQYVGGEKALKIMDWTYAEKVKEMKRLINKKAKAAVRNENI